MNKKLGITKRIDLNLGYSCNLKCRFCYYQKTMKKPVDLPTEKAKQWLRFFRKKGKENIDLTGGEPTIRKDIVELVRYARDIGYKKICIITNGLKLANKDFAHELAAAGLNDVLFSLHGPTARIHESLTCVPKSYDKIIEGINNIKAADIRFRSNTVVNGISYQHVGDTAERLIDLGAERLNFILFNPIVEAGGSDGDMNISYKEAAPYLQKVIDVNKHRVKKITVRYMPFCTMKGYEQYITNTPQIQYDPDEWDYLWRTYFREKTVVWLGALCLGFLLHPSFNRLKSIDFNNAKHEAIKWSLTYKNKTKGPICKKCAYEKICDALWRDYAQKKGFEELDCIEGEKIVDPTHFMERNEQFYI